MRVEEAKYSEQREREREREYWEVGIFEKPKKIGGQRERYKEDKGTGLKLKRYEI